ncbi:hypothetical protein ACIBQ0_17270 [Nocardia nova]|uniref:hypothetical protein n=1 Tax=Nocardia nova TaxID=37330 RepID=UPI0037A918C2
MKISRIPEPALIRSALVAITGIIALIVGHNVDVSWIETVVTVYAAVSPFIAGLLIRPAVTPVAKGTGSDGE